MRGNIFDPTQRGEKDYAVALHFHSSTQNTKFYVSIENSIQTNVRGNILLEFRKLLIPLLYIATSVNLYTVQCSYSLSKMAHRLVLQLIQMTLLLYSTQRCFLTLSCSIKTFKKFNFFQINTNSEHLLFVIYNLDFTVCNI